MAKLIGSLFKRYRARKLLNKIIDEWRRRNVARLADELLADGARICSNCYFWRRTWPEVQSMGRCQNSGNWTNQRVPDHAGVVTVQSPIALRPVTRLHTETCPLFLSRGASVTEAGRRALEEGK